MSTISSVGKVAYIYNESSDTWHPVAGYANVTAPYTWSGAHSFNNTVNFNSVLTAKAGVNNFFDEVERNANLPSPENGAVCFVRSLNQIQYYSGSSWRVYGDNANLIEKTTNHTLELSDAGKTLQINSSSLAVITIPTQATAFSVGAQIAFIRTGTGRVEFRVPPGSNINILSKNGNRAIAAQWSPATLIKRDATNWILIGDLTAV
jgi:uncharacterized membrane protein